MRDVRSLDPMWDPDTPKPLRGRALAHAVGRVAKAVAPFLVTWAAGMKPQLRLAWGSTEYHLQRDGIAAVRRDGPGFDDNPRSNYNERLRMRQERAAQSPPPAPAPTESPAPPVAEPPPAERPKLDFSAAALQRAVDEKMGVGSSVDPISDPETLKATLAQVRASLQALDDVKDWSAVETLDDELYKLHRAVEYKMRNHKASEAKSKLDDLFK